MANEERDIQRKFRMLQPAKEIGNAPKSLPVFWYRSVQFGDDENAFCKWMVCFCFRPSGVDTTF